MKRFNFPEEEKKHLRIFKAKMPKNVEEMDTMITALAASLVEGCADHEASLAKLAYGFVGKNGPVPSIIQQVAENCGVPVQKLALTFLVFLGKELFTSEIAMLKGKCEADGCEADGHAILDWIKEQAEADDNFGTFSRTMRSMEKLGCNCPACIMFWAAKRYQEQYEPSALIDEFVELSDKDVEPGGESCVRHLIPGADQDDGWNHTKGSSNN